MTRQDLTTKRPGNGTRMLCILAILVLVPVAGGAEDAAVMFEQNCAPCHGSRGTGLAPGHPRLATFDPPPALLNDPLFNSREPAQDWFLVVKHGGPSLGLSSQMPAFGGAFTDAEIEALVTHMKTLAETSAYPPGALNFPRPVDTIKAFPEDEALILNRLTSEEGQHDVLQTILYYGQRIGPRSQIELKAVYVDEGDEADFEDVELGFKHAFYFNLDRLLLFGGGLEVEIPVQGGGGDEVWIPYLSLAKGVGSFTFQGTLKSHLPGNDFGAGDVTVSAVLHYLPSPWPRGVVPGLEGKVAVPFESEADFEASLIPQLLIGLSKLGHVRWGVGVEVPVTGIDYDYRIRTFLLWDFADGSFWKHW